ncbi:beta strand repeat-containing protein [Usitatibacter palustris]|uniref:Fibronectin type-III domain-containing protein n=1 Tax=Usitatibacter palustris TaxID=2732487 RepID=A0A6M4HCA6_9PROT|nr:IPTL-CTERM sorting domain-containing protein [Usitatibacter palustris]QJR16695.1 hypothetical protein DSM104440_03531 [Usitatibacter palustris]
MMRWLLASAMLVACALGAPAKAQVSDQAGGDARVEQRGLKAASNDAVYSNLATFRNQSYAAGGAAQQLLNTITRLAADDLTLAGTPPYQVNGFRFTVTNQNAVDVSARMLVRFYAADGLAGGPGTLIAAFTYNPIVFTAGRVGTIKTSTRFVLDTSRLWAGISFDNANGSTGATAEQLNNLAQGIFSPPDLGTSGDLYFVTAAAGSFASDNPVGALSTFAGGPPADFGWEILAEQATDLSVTNTDNVTTAFPGGNVTYTINARNAGPFPVFGARLVDTFPSQLTCNWTCAGGAGSTCAASGAGNINDATVNLVRGGSVTYTATCAVSLTATGTLVNTATFLTPGTAVDPNFGDNVATDTDTIGISADLAITNTDGVTTAQPGGNVTYTITASNAGPGGASGATVTTTFPSSLTCTWICIGAGGSCTPGGNGSINDTVFLPPGGRVIYTAGCTVSPSATGTLSVTAAIAAPAGVNDLAPANNSATDTTALVAALPGAPTIGVASAGNAQAGVTFTPPVLNGGATITSYTVTSSPGGITASGPASPIAVTGLTNGTAYTFTVTATNSVGTGPPSAPSNSVTPVSLPGAPTIGVATAGNTQATIAFTPPAANGGTAITSYTVTSSPGGITASGAASPIVVGGLANGTAYTFTVRATTAVGTGPASSPSNSVTPATIPGAPFALIAAAGNAQALVAFTQPASNGGLPVTSYTVTSSPGGIVVSGAASPLIVSGLTNGTAYTFTVTATNAIGTGPASAPSNSVTPTTVPGAPTIGVATAGNAQATVTFTPPSSTGGSAITSYTVTSSIGGITASGAASPIVVTGLTNGTAYTFTVTATNAQGTGLPSAASNSVTPVTLPGAPTIGVATAGNAQASVAFTPPASNGGSAITSYTVTSSPGGIVASGAASPIVVNGLANGTAYTFTVTATTAVGTGPASAPSNSVTPGTLPGAPTIGTATAGNSQATVTFTPPTSNGGSPITSYTATSSPGGITASAPSSPIVVSGLANGTAYTFTVTATNAVGTGPSSAPSNSVTPISPATVPGAPRIIASAAGNGRATIAFRATSDGGSTITSYTLTCGAFTASGPTSPLTVTGLTNGSTYNCSVTATNAIGISPPSDPVSVTPQLIVRSYIAPSATGSGTIIAVFTGGGLTCTFANSRYIPVSGDPSSPPTAPSGGIVFPHGLFEFTLSGCTPGSTVNFTISYPAGHPVGTQYWKYGPEPATPAPHWYVLPATIAGDTVRFSITDGGQGDDDLLANGTIVDQGGPGAPAGSPASVPIPTLSEWAMLLLAMLMLGFALPAVSSKR